MRALLIGIALVGKKWTDPCMKQTFTTNKFYVSNAKATGIGYFV